ncbi:MAG TPA: endonuclease domain-containing protein [Rhizomicrobium sp.]
MKHELARKLRRDQTEVERKLWYALRGRRFCSFKFRRQQPIGPYVVDFICFEAKLVIELDGGQHGLSENAQAEWNRTTFLVRQGFRVLRFWNHEMRLNFDGVIDTIYRAIGG